MKRAGQKPVRAGATAAAAALAALTLATGCSSIHSGQHSGAVTGPSSAKTPPPFSASSPPPSAVPAGARVSSGDRDWLNHIHQANLAEVEAGTLTAKKSSDGAVQSVGSMLASQHSSFDDKVKAVAAELHLTLPDYLTLADSQASDRLGTETGYAYDHDFTSTMMTSHQQVISETQAEISHGSSPVITDLARQALPILRNHLAALQAVAAAP